ncbi:hypothetical protein ATER59S_00461 [Aquamicrobium terrae]
MALHFTLDNDGYLDWHSPVGTKPSLTIEEARIIAEAEQAAALRSLLQGLLAIAEAVENASQSATDVGST